MKTYFHEAVGEQKGNTVIGNSLCNYVLCKKQELEMSAHQFG